MKPADGELPNFESDSLEQFVLVDPQAEASLLLAAGQRRMDPSDYLAVLVDCERKGN